MSSETRIKLMEAIVRRMAIAARYNGNEVRLAPHVLFERHGDLFVGALDLGKQWRAGEEQRLGQYKLAGLGTAELLTESFEPLPSFQAVAPRQADTLIMTIE